MLQHYQLLKPRLNLGPSTTAHVDYAKYLLSILVLLKFVRASNGIHTSPYCFVFLKIGGEILKQKLRTPSFLTQLNL